MEIEDTHRLNEEPVCDIGIDAPYPHRLMGVTFYLGRNFDVLNMARGLRNRKTVVTQASKVEFNGFSDLRFRFFHSGACRDATEEVRDIS